MANRQDEIGQNNAGWDFSQFTLSTDPSAIAFDQTAGHLSSLTGTSLIGENVNGSDDKKMMTPPATQDHPWGVWGAGTFVIASQDSYGANQAYHSFTGSPTLGFDYRLMPNFTLGFFASYADTTATFSDFSHLEVSSESFGIYGLWNQDNWKVKGIIGGGPSQYESNRQVLSAVAHADPDGDQFFTDFTGGRDFNLGSSWVVTPEVGVQYAHLEEDSYNESNAGIFGLSVASQSEDSFRVHEGFRVSHTDQFSGWALSEKVNAAAYHEFLDDARNVNEGLLGAPTLGSFVSRTVSPERDFAVLGFGLDARFKIGATDCGAFLDYDVQAGQSHYLGQSINGGMRVQF